MYDVLQVAVSYVYFSAFLNDAFSCHPRQVLGLE